MVVSERSSKAGKAKGSLHTSKSHVGASGGLRIDDMELSADAKHHDALKRYLYRTGKLAGIAPILADGTTLGAARLLAFPPAGLAPIDPRHRGLS